MSNVLELEITPQAPLAFTNLLGHCSEETKRIAHAKPELAHALYRDYLVLKCRFSENMQRITFECMVSQAWVYWCRDVKIPGGYQVKF